MVIEGALLGCAGGVVGCLSAALFFHWSRFTLGNEGLTLALRPSYDVAAYGLLVALVLGLLASVWPALVSARKPIVASLRSV